MKVSRRPANCLVTGYREAQISGRQSFMPNSSIEPLVRWTLCQDSDRWLDPHLTIKHKSGREKDIPVV